MAIAFRCDKCGEFYDKGFMGSWHKDLLQGEQIFEVSLHVSRSPHLCKSCWPKFCKILYDDMRGSYVVSKKLENRVSQEKG